MKIAAANALAKLAKEPASDELKQMYAGEVLEFGVDYVIPKPFDKRVKAAVSTAIATAAVKDGVAKLKSFDEKAYFESLS